MPRPTSLWNVKKGCISSAIPKKEEISSRPRNQNRRNWSQLCHSRGVTPKTKILRAFFLYFCWCLYYLCYSLFPSPFGSSVIIVLGSLTSFPLTQQRPPQAQSVDPESQILCAYYLVGKIETYECSRASCGRQNSLSRMSRIATGPPSQRSWSSACSFSPNVSLHPPDGSSYIWESDTYSQIPRR